MQICGGITTWGGNPSICLYEVDAETMLPVKRFTYSFNMEQANSDGFITWNLHTNWLTDYNLTDLSPSSIFEFS
jgi:Acid sphingomyelin phosphodiesterase C-terminal region